MEFVFSLRARRVLFEELLDPEHIFFHDRTLEVGICEEEIGEEWSVAECPVDFELCFLLGKLLARRSFIDARHSTKELSLYQVPYCESLWIFWIE